MSSRPVRHNKTCFYYRPQTKFAKIMFLHVSVSHSVHMGGGWYPACFAGLQAHIQEEVEGSGLGGLQAHNQGEMRGLAWGVSRPTPMGEVEGLAWGVSRSTPRGEVEGSCLGGGLQAHTWGGVSRHALRQTPPQQTATASGGTHPTGIHSCSIYLFHEHQIMQNFVSQIK